MTITCPLARIGAPKQSMMSKADSQVHRHGRHCTSPAGYPGIPGKFTGMSKVQVQSMSRP